MPSDTNATLTNTTIAASKESPLMSELKHVEDLVSSLVLRLEPVTNHMPSEDKAPTSNTITGRLRQVADVVEYYLTHIEL